MKMKKHMLSVVMDGIKDTRMLADYAQEAAGIDGNKDLADWFAVRAKTRLSHLERDWKDVDEELEEHDRGSELLDALECHVNRSISDLKARVESL